MEKTVKSKLFERGEYKIEVKEDLLTITCNEEGPTIEIQKAEVKGEIKDQERALEIAEKYILNLEQGEGGLLRHRKGIQGSQGIRIGP